MAEERQAVPARIPFGLLGIFLLLVLLPSEAFLFGSLFGHGGGYGGGYGRSSIYPILPPSNVTAFCLLNLGACVTPGSCVSYYLHDSLRYHGNLLCNTTHICCLPTALYKLLTPKKKNRGYGRRRYGGYGRRRSSYGRPRHSYSGSKW